MQSEKEGTQLQIRFDIPKQMQNASVSLVKQPTYTDRVFTSISSQDQIRFL